MLSLPKVCVRFLAGELKGHKLHGMAKLKKKKKKALPLEVLQRANADKIPEFQATCISSHHISKVKSWLASPSTGISPPQNSCAPAKHKAGDGLKYPLGVFIELDI